METDEPRDQEEPGAATDPVLAANLEKLFGGRAIGALRADMARAGIAIGQGTLNEAKQGRTGKRLETLQKIAAYFDVTVEQLLQPDLGRGGATWPFSAELYARVEGLEKVQLEKLERALVSALELMESATTHMGDAAREQLQRSAQPTSVKTGTRSQQRRGG